MAVGINKQNKVLIVEDSEDLQDLLKQLFESIDYSCLHAFNGQEALEVLQKDQEPPRFILLDMMMPTMTGAEFREVQIKDERLSAIPVVVMTADPNALIQAKQLGVTNFLNKPVSIDKLIEFADQFRI